MNESLIITAGSEQMSSFRIMPLVAPRIQLATEYQLPMVPQKASCCHALCHHRINWGRTKGPSTPCIRLARGKFELTNQDSAGGKNSSVLV